MKRRTRIAAVALGAILLSGLVATLAPLTDSAETGTNSIESAADPSSIDLQITENIGAFPATTSCQQVPGGYIENQPAATPVVNLTNAVPGTTQRVEVCVRNTGANPATVSDIDVFDLVDVETGCTGDETEVDATCGSSGQGELADQVRLQVVPGPSASTDAGAPCQASQEAIWTIDGVSSATGLAPTSGTWTLGAGERSCVDVILTYLGSTTLVQKTENQTDKVSLRIRFNAS